MSSVAQTGWIACDKNNRVRNSNTNTAMLEIVFIDLWCRELDCRKAHVKAVLHVLHPISRDVTYLRTVKPKERRTMSQVLIYNQILIILLESEGCLYFLVFPQGRSFVMQSLLAGGKKLIKSQIRAVYFHCSLEGDRKLKTVVFKNCCFQLRGGHRVNCKPKIARKQQYIKIYKENSSVLKYTEILLFLREGGGKP